MGTARRRFVGLGTSVAVVALALSAALPTFFAQPPLGRTAMVLSLAAIALYALCGTIGLRWIERYADGRFVLHWLLMMLLVGAGAVAASRGTAALLLYAVVSMAVLYLRRVLVALFIAGAAAVVFGVWATQAQGAYALVGAFVSYGAGLAFVSVFSRMVRTQHEQRAELERLSAEIESLATTAERNRIAREIHDGLGHYLTVVHVQLEAAELLLSKDPERARASVSTARRLTREGLDDVRRSVAVLRGRAPVDKPLPEAIAVMAEACAAAGIEVRTEIRGTPRELSSTVAVTLFRAAQEAFTNVQRHARAKSVQVELGFDRPGRAWLRVEDDGVGTAMAEGGFGLVGLRERVSLVGGQVTIRSSPGQGFAVEVDVPA